MSIKKTRDERKDKILDAALDLFAEKGVQSVTIDEIAGRAGVGKGTVYRKVGNRDKFIELLIDMAVDVFLKTVDESVSSRDNPILRFKELICAICDVQQRHHKLMLLVRSQVLLQINMRGSDTLKGLLSNQRISEAMRHIEHIVQDAIDAGYFIHYNPKAVSKSLVELLNPYTFKYFTDELGYTKFEIAHFVTNLFLNGLLKKGLDDKSLMPTNQA